MNICLFGSGSKDIDDTYIQIGYELGRSIAQNNHTLIFGGGNDGMMGSVARGVSDNNGSIIAIMPEWMGEFEDLYNNCDDIIYTESMAERKIKFIESSDVFIISPGGIGTLDEFFEVLTLKKLKNHNKQIIIFNIDNFYDKMLDMLKTMIDEGFIEDFDNSFTVTTSLEDTLNAF